MKASPCFAKPSALRRSPARTLRRECPRDQRAVAEQILIGAQAAMKPSPRP